MAYAIFCFLVGIWIVSVSLDEHCSLIHQIMVFKVFDFAIADAAFCLRVDIFDSVFLFYITHKNTLL